MLRFEDFNLSIPNGSRVIVRGDVAPGEIKFIQGPSGCGKSTLLMAISGFYQHDSGDLRLDDEQWGDLPAEKRSVFLMHQESTLFPHLDVRENLKMVFRYSVEGKALTLDERENRVSDILRVTGLKKTEKQFPSSLSGGEKQRVCLARALLVESRVLLLDEPFSALDSQRKSELGDWAFSLIYQQKKCVLWVSHDDYLAKKMNSPCSSWNKEIEL